MVTVGPVSGGLAILHRCRESLLQSERIVNAKMVEYKTMRVPAPAWEAAAEAKGDDETWGEYLRRCADEPRVEMSEAEVRAMVREMVVREALR